MPDDARRIPAFCPLCVSRCGCEAVVENGRLVALEPDPSHPTGKALCAKGRAAPELVDARDRLLVSRCAVRGRRAIRDPGWQRIGWDEALDETASALRRIADESGPEAVAFSVTTAAGTAISDAMPWIYRLINSFGSPNNCNGTEICSWHREFAGSFTTGAGIGTPDYERAGCILLWGHNPSTSLACRRWRRIADARARGAKLVVVDPATDRPCGQGRSLAAGAARHRWRAGAVHCRRDDRARLVRRRLRARLDQRPVPGA